jgi:hypothetical protein
LLDFIGREFSIARRNHVFFATAPRLIEHLGRESSYPEQIIIARAVAIEWELPRLDATRMQR